MANAPAMDRQEIEFRRRWYEAHARRAEPDIDSGRFSDWLSRFRASAPEALGIRDRLVASGDLDRFRADQQAWAAKPGTQFKRPDGSWLISSLVNHTDDRSLLARLLADGLTAPRDRVSAARKMDALIKHIERIKVGAHPPPGSVPFMLSHFWSLEQPERWPVYWINAREFLEASIGNSLSGSPTERYLRFLDLTDEVDDNYDRFARVTIWSERNRPAFLDPVLVDRCAYGLDPDALSPEDLDGNAAALVGIAGYLGRSLVEDVTEASGYSCKPAKLPKNWKKSRPRSDLWVDWRFEGLPGPALRLWVNHRGAAIGVVPGHHGIRQGWNDEARAVIAAREVEGLRLMAAGGAAQGEDMGFRGSPGSFIYGRWYEPGQFADLDLRTEVREVASAVRPLIEALIRHARGEAQGDANGIRPAPSDDPDPSGSLEDDEADRLGEALDEAAEDLLVDRTFLEDIVELLKDKGQVILYGPPGTGKTYLARRLARALTPDPADRTLVQFHPSTSYEDFFEGYRPGTGVDGRIVYRLTPGPLARMAERAAHHPGRRQVMLIDEINRANLPKVLGELLFLLEYRDQSIATLYRPEGGFRLPESLWFLGTMNTADRSIALVDAALRRRFHFVPFFPDRGPTEGLLERWLEWQGQPAWVDELVAMVNDELTRAIGAELQLGASHFMKVGYLAEPDGDDRLLRRIWEYNIEPFIEDQLFGNREQIERFRFKKALARYRSSAGLDEQTNEPEVVGDGAGEQTSTP